LAWDLREEYRSKRKTGRKRAADTTTTTTTTIDDAAEQTAKKAKSLDGASQKIKDEIAAQKVEEEPSKRSLLKSEKREGNKNCSRRLKRGESKRLMDENAFIARRKLESSQKFDEGLGRTSLSRCAQ
jgi:hypothetical protein